MAGPATVAAVGLWPAQAAQASPAATVHVPCSAAALASDIASAASGETLTLAAGCAYNLTAALPVVGQNLTIAGNQATLKRSTATATPAFTILSVDAGTLTVSNLNFSNGNGALSETQNGSLTVHGGTFTGNSAAAGGAIYAYGGMGNLSVTGALFTKNQATGNGGAIYSNLAAGSTTVTNDTFVNNTAGTIGGGLYNFFDTDVSDSIFSGNQATDGGAIFNNALGGDILTKVTMQGNTASQNGGGIATYNTDLSIANSHITGNHAGDEGGGVYQEGALGYPGLELTSTTVQQNTAGNGAGIYSVAEDAQLTNSPVGDNHATADGGGIYNDGGGVAFGSVALGSSAVSNNSARANGGGIYNEGTGNVTATSSKIVHNAAAAGGGIYDDSGSTTTLTSSPVQYNTPDNCEPPGSITGCTNSAQSPQQQRATAPGSATPSPSTGGQEPLPLPAGSHRHTGALPGEGHLAP